jgi:hypothetical protein
MDHLDVAGVRAVVFDAFVEIHRCSHQDAVSRLGIKNAGEMLRTAEALAKTRVGYAAWSQYRDGTALYKARAASRAANGTPDGSTIVVIPDEPGTPIGMRIDGRGARRRRQRNFPAA